MSELLVYFFKVFFLSACFTFVYLFFLKASAKHHFKRAFLLLSLLFSIMVPFTSINLSESFYNKQNYFDTSISYVSGTITKFSDKAAEPLAFYNWFQLAYIIICCLLFVISLFALVSIYKKVKSKKVFHFSGLKLIKGEECQSLSFFNFLIIGEALNLKEKKAVMFHELAHIRQKHFLDLLLVELLNIVFWYNPFFYVLKREIQENHEFLADSYAVSKLKNTGSYQQVILSVITNRQTGFLVSNWTFKRIKARIKRIQNAGSKSKSRLLVSILISFSFVVSVAFVSNNNKIIEKQEFEPAKSNLRLSPLEKGKYRVSATFGEMINPITRKKVFHKGVDLAAENGLPIYVTGTGTVRKVVHEGKKDQGYGKYIIVDHADDYSTFYSHLSECAVKEGDNVKEGQLIGYVGSTGMSTGPHLHYEIMKNGKNLDPAGFFLQGE